MNQLRIIVGFTHTDRRADYLPAEDGYRPGAVQTVLTLDPVPVSSLGDQPVTAGDTLTLKQAETIAEACYGAMNRPSTAPSRLEHDIKTAMEAALQEWKNSGNPAIEHVHTMQVGDTVTVGDITLMCMGKGWEQVAISAACDTTPDAR